MNGLCRSFVLMAGIRPGPVESTVSFQTLRPVRLLGEGVCLFNHNYHSSHAYCRACNISFLVSSARLVTSRLSGRCSHSFHFIDDRKGQCWALKWCHPAYAGHSAEQLAETPSACSVSKNWPWDLGSLDGHLRCLYLKYPVVASQALVDDCTLSGNSGFRNRF